MTSVLHYGRAFATQSALYTIVERGRIDRQRLGKKYLNYASRHRSSKIFLILLKNILFVLKKLRLLHWSQHNLLQIIEIAVNFTANTPNIPLIYAIHYRSSSDSVTTLL